MGLKFKQAILGFFDVSSLIQLDIADTSNFRWFGIIFGRFDKQNPLTCLLNETADLTI